MHHHKPYNFSLSISCHAGYQRAASTKHRLDQPLGSFILYPHPLKLAVNWTLNKTESERVYTQQQFSEETGHKPSQAERPGWHKQTLTAVSRFSLVPFQVNKQRIWIELGSTMYAWYKYGAVLKFPPATTPCRDAGNARDWERFLHRMRSETAHSIGPYQNF